MSVRTYTAYVQFDPETKLYVGTVPSLPGAHTQAATLDELQRNLQEVIALCLEERAAANEPVEEDTFVGVQQIEVSV
jgi:predicted RNase H-like HicB family nuclease